MRLLLLAATLLVAAPDRPALANPPVAAANPRVAVANPPEPVVDPERVIRMTATRFRYSPDVIEVEQGVPVILQLTSLDRDHGFSVPDLGLRIDVEPEKTAQVRFVPDKPGTFPFHCDVFCGSGHEEMAGRIVVTPRKGGGGVGGH